MMPSFFMWEEIILYGFEWQDTLQVFSEPKKVMGALLFVSSPSGYYIARFCDHYEAENILSRGKKQLENIW